MTELLPTLELQTGNDPRGSVIWMHGLGADGWDFLPIVHELQLPEDLALRFVFPHAPRQPVQWNNGAVMRAWYDISSDGLERKPDEAGIRRSGARIEQLIVRERERGIPAHRIIIAGFSQGGVMALHAGLRHAETLGGVMALSTYLGIPDALATEGHPANARTPILMVHGTQDAVIPIAHAERSRQHLLGLHYSVDWQSYPMAHTVAMEEIRRIADFLRKRLAG